MNPARVRTSGSRRRSSSTETSNGQPERQRLTTDPAQPTAVVATSGHRRLVWVRRRVLSRRRLPRGGPVTSPPEVAMTRPCRAFRASMQLTGRLGHPLPAPGNGAGVGPEFPAGHRKLTNLTVMRSSARRWLPPCQAVMIAFMAVRHSSVCRVTSGQIRPRTATNRRERDQLQPELPPRWPALSPRRRR